MKDSVVANPELSVLAQHKRYVSHIYNIVRMTRAAPGPVDALAALNDELMLIDATPGVVRLPINGKAVI